MKKTLKVALSMIFMTMGVIMSSTASAVSITDMPVGAYVTYQPSSTNIDLTALTGISQPSLNPSATTLWRVLTNNGTKVELVSADTVGTLTLSERATRAADGSYSEGDSTIVQNCRTNYANAIFILNEISRQYALGAGTGRGLGYNGNATNVEQITTPLTHEYMEENYTHVVSQDPYDDIYYRQSSDATCRIADGKVLLQNNMMHTTTHAADVWLASRRIDINDTYTNFTVRSLTSSGTVTNNTMYQYDIDNSRKARARTDGVRPVVCLASGVGVSSGQGTSGSPYVLCVTHEFGTNGKCTTCGKTLSITDMPVGAYVTYKSAVTSVNLTALTGISQTALNPSTTTSWRVLTNDGTEVELVSADTVGTLTLGQRATKEANGSFSEGNQAALERSQKSYADSIYILNEISRQFASGIGT